MNVKFLLGIMLLFASSTVWSATIYAPTNQDVNFINTDDLCYASGTGCPNAILGIFDDSDLTYAGNYLAISMGQGGDQASFSPTILGQATDYTVTNNSLLTPGSLTLTNSDHFLIALKDPILTGSWVAPTSEQCFSNSTTCLLSWDLGGSTYAIDLEQVLPPAGVPVPPAVWLFGSGLLGMVGIARRRKTA